MRSLWILNSALSLIAVGVMDSWIHRLRTSLLSGLWNNNKHRMRRTLPASRISPNNRNSIQCLISPLISSHAFQSWYTNHHWAVTVSVQSCGSLLLLRLSTAFVYLLHTISHHDEMHFLSLKLNSSFTSPKRFMRSTVPIKFKPLLVVARDFEFKITKKKCS